MIEKVMTWWMDLEPPKQLMYWVLSFAITLGIGILMIAYIGTTGIAVSPHVIGLVLLTVIGTFLGIFLLGVLFLSIVWPIILEKNK